MIYLRIFLFTDAELELLGSNQGYLIIGNKVIAPE